MMVKYFVNELIDGCYFYLKNYTDDDYLLMMGDPSIIGVACAIVAQNNVGRFNVLKWDRQEAKYYPIKFNLYEKGELDDD